MEYCGTFDDDNNELHMLSSFTLVAVVEYFTHIIEIFISSPLLDLLHYISLYYLHISNFSLFSNRSCACAI